MIENELRTHLFIEFYYNYDKGVLAEQTFLFKIMSIFLMDKD